MDSLNFFGNLQYPEYNASSPTSFTSSSSTMTLPLPHNLNNPLFQSKQQFAAQEQVNHHPQHYMMMSTNAEYRATYHAEMAVFHTKKAEQFRQMLLKHQSYLAATLQANNVGVTGIQASNNKPTTNKDSNRVTKATRKRSF
jgi:predicted membrane-bound mannosyltransferase